MIHNPSFREMTTLAALVRHDGFVNSIDGVQRCDATAAA